MDRVWPHFVVRCAVPISHTPPPLTKVSCPRALFYSQIHIVRNRTGRANIENNARTVRTPLRRDTTTAIYTNESPRYEQLRDDYWAKREGVTTGPLTPRRDARDVAPRMVITLFHILGLEYSAKFTNGNTSSSKSRTTTCPQLDAVTA
jgi:hypothetical protein